MAELYPVTIIRARYGGAYEGGKWVAFNLNHYDHKIAMATSDDVSTADFFRFVNDFELPIGRGDTPDEALADLWRFLNA